MKRYCQFHLSWPLDVRSRGEVILVGLLSLLVVTTVSNAQSTSTNCLLVTRSGSVTNSATRTARFWFTHPFPTDVNCVNLQDGLQASGVTTSGVFQFDLGFITLPVGYRNNSNARDPESAAIEALGFYWRKFGLTGELDGQQDLEEPGSRICELRKRLSIELLAAAANVNLLGTLPSVATYNNGRTRAHFPDSLLCDGVTALRSDSLENMVAVTALLRKFNASGLTNQFPAGLVECDALPKKVARSISRDPTTQLNCPGLNDTCETAMVVLFPNAQTNILAQAVFTSRADLRKYSDSVASPDCGLGGANAVWKITPSTGKVGRRFTVDTFRSNIPTLLTVYSGSCSNSTELTCAANSNQRGQSQVRFTTDGTNTYYVVAEGFNGAIGRINLKITSP